MAWKEAKPGEVTFFPVLEFGLAVPHGTAVGIQIVFARDPNGLRTGGERIHLVLTPVQALELAKGLQHAAQLAMKPQAEGYEN